MKILIISCVFAPEPVVSAQLSHDIALALSAKHEVTVLSPKPTRPKGFDFGGTKQPEDLPYRHVVLDSYVYPDSGFIGRLRESRSFGVYCKAFIEENATQIDFIYQNTWPLFAQYLVVKAAKNLQIPVITHVQDVYPESLVSKLPAFKKTAYKMLLPIDRYILKNSRKVICISKNMASSLQKTRHLNSDALEVVTNWQDEDQFSVQKTENKGQNEPFTFMYLGNNGPLAGVEFLIETFHEAEIPNAQLVIAGSGSKKADCQALAEQLMAKNIVFVEVAPGKVPKVQSGADVMLLPVKKNGAYSSIPSKLPAYMFSKKAILGSLDLDSDTATAILDADSGIVTPPEDANALMKAMKEMASWDKALLQQKGENAYQYSLKHFSKKQNLTKIISIFENLSR